jgi:hypothetical protein
MNITTRALFAAVILMLPLAAQTKPTGQKKSSGPGQSATGSQQKPAESKPPATGANVLPANAQKIGDGMWKATDASGQTWIYYETMFGYSRRTEADYLAGIGGRKPAPVKGGVEIPADAVLIDEGHWEAKDASGKVWVYNATPWGISKVEKTKGSQPQTAAPSTLQVLSVAEGQAEFEQVTPFGKSRWTRKLTEMNESEKTAVESFTAAGGKSGKK